MGTPTSSESWRPGDKVPRLEACCEDLRHRIGVQPADAVGIVSTLSGMRGPSVAGLAMNRLHPLQGSSGTGKTSPPVRVRRAVGG